MPATQKGIPSCLAFNVIIIIFIKFVCSGFDTDNARGQGRFLPVVLHGLCITRREHIHITVISRPDGLVVLRTVSTASITDLIGLH